MRVLADENIPRDTTVALRAAGYDVAAIAEDAASIVDLDVLRRAAAESRVLVISDKDFGELAFTAAPALSVHGIILIRAFRPDVISELAIATLAARPDMRQKFVVAEPGRPARVRAMGHS